ncbi:MAG TPA: carboxypeptidase-like regulatory domain-containing protein, partial [Terriglobia bacterium]|nr:carboxypeptidase-like regulatory domain-containing protein [Terriglobia bacterium]
MKFANWVFVLLIFCALLLLPGGSYGQGVTAGSITGTVRDSQGTLVPGVTVTAVHQPSGTTFAAVSLEDGHYLIPAVRVGGPYKVTAALAGFNNQIVNDVEVDLGAAVTVDFKLVVANVQQEVTVEAEPPNPILSADSTGAATAITRDNLATLPSITGTMASVARL